MRADKADKDSANGEFYHYDHTVVVAPDVEYIMLVAYIVRSGKIFADVRKILPLGLLSDVVPSLQRYS